MPLGTVTDAEAGKDTEMRSSTLFNLDALFALVVGLVLLFNPLLGPVLPLPGAIVGVAAVAALVGACVLGRAGMGKGGLVPRIRAIAFGNLTAAVVLAIWAIVSCRAGARVLVLIISTVLTVLGLVQMLTKRTKTARVNTSRRGTVEELQQALRSK